MTPTQIHDAFDRLLAKTPEAHKVARAAGMTSQQAAKYRYLMKVRGRLKLETKLYWLHRSGLMPREASPFTRKDMISFAKFALHPKNKAALNLGMDYLLDKWHAIPKKPKA
jgi:hypothetical protein